MPRAIQVITEKSPYFPGQLELLGIDNQEPPSLGKGPHRFLFTLGYRAWRLYRARQRIKRDKELSERLRDDLLENFDSLYKGLHGFRVFGKRSIEVKVTDQHSDTVLDPPGFIEYLGEYAPSVITGVKLPIQELLGDPENYHRFVKLVAEEFGDELAGNVGITFNRETHHQLVHEGKLEEPPPDLLGRIVGSRQVRIKMLEPR